MTPDTHFLPDETCPTDDPVGTALLIATGAVVGVGAAVAGSFVEKELRRKQESKECER